MSINKTLHLLNMRFLFQLHMLLVRDMLKVMLFFSILKKKEWNNNTLFDGDWRESKKEGGIGGNCPRQWKVPQFPLETTKDVIEEPKSHLPFFILSHPLKIAPTAYWARIHKCSIQWTQFSYSQHPYPSQRIPPWVSLLCPSLQFLL